MIGIYNIDENLKSELSKYVELYDMVNFTDFVKIDGLIIDWVDKEDSGFVAQAAIVEHYARKSIPIIVYDRFMSVNSKEYSWLKKFNAEFLEPALNYRTGFEYLPQWSDLQYEIGETQFDLGYIGKLNRRVKLFEKYYRDTATLWPKMNIKYEPKDVIDDKKEIEWVNDGIFKDRHHDYDFNFSVIIDSHHNIDIGYLPNNLFKLIKHGVVPLCPIEQKYFHGIFYGLIVEKPSEVEYYTNTFRNLREALIDDIIENIRKNYPEFTIEYACDKIMRKLMI